MENSDMQRFDESVERFLSNRMSAQEEVAFKEELESSEELRDRASTIAMVIKTMQEMGRERDEKIISKAHSMTEKELRDIVIKGENRVAVQVANVSSKVPTGFLWAIAACFIGAIILMPFSWKDNRTIKLGEASYTAYTFYNEGIARSADISNVTDVLKPLYSNIEKGKDIGNTILELEHLYELSKDDTSDYYGHEDDIAWNLAIGNLKTRHRKEAKIYLEDIVKRNEKYPNVVKVAQDLINKINKI